MAYIKKKICVAPNCPNYAEQGSAYCTSHKKETNRDTTSRFKNFYKTSWWVKNRLAFLLDNMYCVECDKEGKHTLSTVVHHSCGFNNWETFCDKSKWVAVCSSCHSKIHTKYTNEDLYNKYYKGE